MKTPIQQLIEKYNDHLKHDDDLDSISGRDILKIVLVDLISYQVKEQETILDACKYGFQVDAESDNWLGDDEQARMYYNKIFEQD